MIPIESHENIHLYSKELDGYRNRILELIVQTYGKLRYLQSDDPEWVYFPIDSAFLYSEKMDENIKSFADTVKKLILEFSK